MRIWVDADACPGEIKDILFRAAQRRQIQVTLVANQALRTPSSPWIDTILVPGGMNVADRRIVELAAPGDLVVTADIPLAAEVVGKGSQALDPRGELYLEIDPPQGDYEIGSQRHNVTLGKRRARQPRDGPIAVLVLSELKVCVLVNCE